MSVNDKQNLLRTINQVYWQLQKQLNKQLKAETGLELSEWLILFSIQEKAVTQNTLVTQLGFTAAGVTGAIDKLVKQKLVERIADETDRRANKIQITKFGDTVFKQSQLILTGITGFLFSGIDAEKLQSTNETLRRLSANLVASKI
jgi:DNA-binding MarR family transcriptional regulator